MTTRRRARLVFIAVVSITAAACGASAPSRFYTLDSTATPEGAPSAAYSVSVGPVSIPAAVDRPQFVVQDGPNRVSVEEFNRWIAPLENSIARVVAGDLAALLGTPRVAVEPLAHFDPDYRVTLDIQRFESAPGRSALIDAVWTVRPAAGGPARSGRTVAQEPAQGEGFEALAAAHSRALAQVSRDIAGAIRSEAGAAGKPP